MAFTYAFGPFEMDEAKPASAFSRGDLLCYNSASSLSRLDDNADLADIAGVAAADSTKSVKDLVTYIKANPDTTWWATGPSLDSLTRGEISGVNYSAASGHYVNSSHTIARLVVERAAADIPGQSVQSRVQVRFIGHDGNLAHS